VRNGFLPNGDGGGNVCPPQSIQVRRTAALGDALACSVVADRLKEMGYLVHFQTHPHVAPLMKRVPSIHQVSLYRTHPDIDLDNCYEDHPERKKLHFHKLFFDAANTQLKARGITLGPPLNCRPKIIVTDNERALANEQLSKYPKPWVFICPGSQYYNVRWVPEYIWEQAAKKIAGTKFWIGLRDAPPGIVDLKIREVNQLVTMLSAADLLISPDTGPIHIAAAMGVQVLAIEQSSSPSLHLSDLCDFETIGLGLDCENCQLTACPKGRDIPPCQYQNPEQIAAAANRKLGRDIVSCLIPTFNATAERLNRCLAAALPQVDEIIVSAAADGRIPRGIIAHDKIRIVQSGRSNLGFGKNVNFGMRHASGANILVLNDDCFLQSNVVARLKQEMKPSVGMVTHLIRYEDGRIYYASKPRGPSGFYHIDHGAYLPTITGTIEIENACGCSFLINRKAFYESKCMNEEPWAYCDDDDLSMRLRLNKWRLIYTSDVYANHIGSATSRTFTDMNQRMNESNLWFGKNWGKYIEWNRNNRNLGNFDYLKA